MMKPDSPRITKDQYEARLPSLRAELLTAQYQLMSADFPVLIVVAGFDVAGRSETINLLNEWLDNRHVATNAFGPASDEERDRPRMWRYWRRLPRRGRIGIFYNAWHGRAMLDRLSGRLTRGAFRRDLARIHAFEQLLCDDGALIVKLLFDLDRETMQQRLRDWEADPQQAWRVGKKQRSRLRHYDRIRDYLEQIFAATDTPQAPWTRIDGSDPRRRALQSGETVLRALKARLSKADAAPSAFVSGAALSSDNAPPDARDSAGHLDQVDLSQHLTREEYRRQLARYQGELAGLSRRVFDEKIPVVLVFQGWDAAGKGGAIRRITQALDARQYQVHSIAAPTPEERGFHYLWRFWRRLPRRGHFAIFDRSWYGRVLVERVEGFASEDQWQRAYEEINQFEQLLEEFGSVVVKYWLHIDPEEQMRRFRAREHVAYKKHKISDEDYRNREKWPQYTVAAETMFSRTSTPAAPWAIVPANDKYFARIRVLKTLCQRLNDAIS